MNSLAVTPGEIVADSTQSAIGTITLSSCPGQEYDVSLSASPSSAVMFDQTAPAVRCPNLSASFTIFGRYVSQPTTVTITATLGASSASATITVIPLTPSISISPSSLIAQSGQSATATFTFNAPIRNQNVLVLGAYPAGILYYIPGGIYLYGGQTSTYLSFTARGAVSAPTPVTLTAWLDASASAVVMVYPLGWTPPPTVNPPDLGPCKQCENQAGAPLNLTTGNAWVQQRDYSLPGLGGGLELVRTWNSQEQDAGPPNVAGMFGHSWRSNYEERLAFPDAQTVMYWRGDGSGWTFSYNSATNSYSLASPPDERAQLVFDPVVSQFTLTLADGSSRVFSQAGALAALLDRNGNQTALAYDSSNHLVSVTEAAGRALAFTYGDANNPGQVTAIQDSVGIMATYSYDSGARLTRVAYADGSSLNFLYDPASSMITSVTDGDGKLLESHTYDSQHRAVTSQRAYGADGVTVSYPTNGQAQLSDSMGNPTTYTYQTIGGRNFMTSVSGPGCSSCGGRGNSTFAYDALGNRTSSTDALGHVTNFTYDAAGNVLTRSVQLNASTTLTWSYTYNQFEQVLTATDALGNTTTNTYDAHGNLLSTTTPSPDGSSPGLTTSFAYDSKGELTQVTDPRGNSTAVAYTSAGMVASTTDAQGNATTFSYDARGNRTSSTDALGNKTTFTYDALNRLTLITQADGSTTGFTYDRRGRRTGVTDANDKTTSYQYDDADRLLAVTDANGGVTIYGYDTENHLASITDALTRATNFSYDALGRVTQLTFPSTLSESYTYDAVGNLLSKTDRKGQTIDYTYDNLDRLTSKTYPDSTGVTYTYDALSRLTQVADPSGTYTFSYDNLGRLLGTTTNYSFLSRTLTMSYTYDAASNRVSLTDPESGITNYAYDQLNRLTSLTDFDGGQFAFSYDAVGRRTSLTRPNGVNTNYQYDALSRVLSVLHQTGAGTLDGATYSYDPVGNRSSKTNLLPTLPAGDLPTSNYGYDAIYQLTQAVQGPTLTESYSYDPVGNRLSSLGVAWYTYNPSNELTAKSNATFTYDANGNTTSKTEPSGTTTYTWDFENRLTSVTLPNGHSQHYKYDPFGRRIFTNSATKMRIHVYDGDNIVERLDPTGKATARLTQGLGIDEPLATYASGLGNFYEADGMGSITSLTDATGVVANTYEYGSFGKLTGVNETVSNTFRYTGREDDGETKLYYYRARYYDFQTGRFLSEDPIGLDGGVNFYPYVSNAGVNRIDPTGLADQGPPVYDPSRWNDPGHQLSNNCYSYACNLLYPPANPQDPTTWRKPQPGERSGMPPSSPKCKPIKKAAKRDGLKDAPSSGCCGSGYHKVWLFVGSNVPPGPGGVPDYHWYRQDSNGMWSSKHGWLPVGAQISDPKKDAQSWGYDTDCGLMCAPNQW